MSPQQKTKSKQPVAVVISDVHYNIQTLEVADTAMRLAIAKANELDVALVVCGDLHDTKANIRGECIKAMLNTFSLCRYPSIILRGNHDALNEKSSEHSLEFLKEKAFVVDSPKSYVSLLEYGEEKLGILPYYHDINELRLVLKTFPKGSTLFMHQGIQDTDSGHYIKDHSAIPKEWLAGYRVISGHYHTRQSFDLPEGGKFDYVGNPFSLNFGEAKDPDKGFQILYEGGNLEFVPTNLRKHCVYEYPAQMVDGYFADRRVIQPGPNDIIWVKIQGTTEELSKITKQSIGLNQEFRLDLIPTTSTIDTTEIAENTSQDKILDNLIENLSNTSEDKKERLKALWKNLI